MDDEDNTQFPAISEGVIGGQMVKTVDGRAIHRFLKIETDFKDWMPRRIAEYGFIEGRDFCSFLSESSGGRRPKEYHVTLDMGKELGMVERNEQGRAIRQYFIRFEEKARALGIKPEFNDWRQLRERRLLIDRAIKSTEKAGLTGMAAIVAAGSTTKSLMGFDLVEAMGIRKVEAETNDVLLTPTEIGKQLGWGDHAGRRVNRVLQSAGYQEKIEGQWKATEKGDLLGAKMMEQGKAHDVPGSVISLHWPSSFIQIVAEHAGDAT